VIRPPDVCRLRVQRAGDVRAQTVAERREAEAAAVVLPEDADLRERTQEAIERVRVAVRLLRELDRVTWPVREQVRDPQRRDDVQRLRDLEAGDQAAKIVAVGHEGVDYGR
jgi:hypothetical protein